VIGRFLWFCGTLALAGCAGILGLDPYGRLREGAECDDAVDGWTCADGLSCVNGLCTAGGAGGTGGGGAGGCGDGNEDPGEECDDGNQLDADGCEADCTLPKCGNGIVDPGEVCLTAAPTPFAVVGGHASDLVVMDCDDDGDPDIVTSGPMISLFTYRNDGSGALDEVVTSAAYSLRRLQLIELSPGVFHLHGLYELSGRIQYFSGDPSAACAFQQLGQSIVFVGTPVDFAIANFDGNAAPDDARLYADPTPGNYGKVSWVQDEMLGGVVEASSGTAMGTAMAAGDLYGDARSEVVVADAGQNQLILFEWDGTKLVAPFMPPPGGTLGAGPSDVVLADMDGDGDLDIVVVNRIAGSVASLLNLGGGTFAAQAPEPQVGDDNPIRAAVGDVDGDGDLDVVTTNGGTGMAGSFSVLINDGTGKLALAAGFPLSLGAQPLAVALADLNGDGALDVVATSAFEDPGTMESSLFVVLSNP